MNAQYLTRFFILSFSFLVLAKAQFTMMDDIDITRVIENCGKWQVSYDWSEMDEYKSSQSHGDNTLDNKQKITTDTLTITSVDNRPRTLKISIVAYSNTHSDPFNSSQIMTLVNETLVKSDVCKEIDITTRLIENRPGIIASGLKCPMDEPVQVAIYPLDYHIDGKGGVLASNALGIILSTYDQKVTNRLIDSIKIEQRK